MRLALSLTLAALPGLATAAGSVDDFTPPDATETTEICEEGLIWDSETEACVAPEEATNDEASLMQNARELAYAERYADASRVLDRLDAADPWVITYRGFLARKTGDFTTANAHYSAAIIADPDHLLARSYMGLGLVEMGKLEEARLQLEEIRNRGGYGTWPEVALTRALGGGEILDY